MDFRSELQILSGRVGTLAEKVRKLDSTVKALKARAQHVQVDVSGLVVGATDVEVTWPHPWPDTSYVVLHEIVAGTTPLDNLHVTIKNATKTTTGVTITVKNTTLATIAAVGVEVVGLRL